MVNFSLIWYFIVNKLIDIFISQLLHLISLMQVMWLANLWLIFAHLIMLQLHYVKGTLFYRVALSSKSPPVLRVYSNANLVRNLVDYWSIIGYCIFFSKERGKGRDSLISWPSKKQTIVAYSNATVEYFGLANIISELLCYNGYFNI